METRRQRDRIERWGGNEETVIVRARKEQRDQRSRNLKENVVSVYNTHLVCPAPGWLFVLSISLSGGLFEICHILRKDGFSFPLLLNSFKPFILSMKTSKLAEHHLHIPINTYTSSTDIQTPLHTHNLWLILDSSSILTNCSRCSFNLFFSLLSSFARSLMNSSNAVFLSLANSSKYQESNTNLGSSLSQVEKADTCEY